jgi:hypothetical protein
MSAYIFESGRNGAKNEYLGINSKRTRAEIPNEKMIKLYTTNPLYATDIRNAVSMSIRRNPWKNNISSHLAWEK